MLSIEEVYHLINGVWPPQALPQVAATTTHSMMCLDYFVIKGQIVYHPIICT